MFPEAKSYKTAEFQHLASEKKNILFICGLMSPWDPFWVSCCPNVQIIHKSGMETQAMDTVALSTVNYGSFTRPWICAKVRIGIGYVSSVGMGVLHFKLNMSARLHIDLSGWI